MPRLGVLTGLLMITCLNGCAPSRPPGSIPESDRQALLDQVRAPAADTEQDELQIYRLRNPAVESLARQAREAEQAGDPDRAWMLLERALRIDPQDAETLQQMAELALARGELEQAAAFAERARELGPGVGALCKRSLRTLMLINERRGQYDEAWKAYVGLGNCRVAPPARY
ncbi:MAG: hypothetical protein Kow0020_03910 [Wenzhouxiangellaceae bacterium]